MDLYHLLSAVVGAFSGLVFYTFFSPGQLPEAPVVAERGDPRADLHLRLTEARRGADGLFHLHGEVKNVRTEPCQTVSILMTFLDANDHPLSTRSAMVEDIPAGGEKPFELRANVPGAVRFESKIEMASF